MPMQYKTVLRVTLLILILAASGAQAATPRPGTAAATVSNLVLLPGDSRSVEWSTGVCCGGTAPAI